MMPGIVFLFSGIYLTFIVSLVISLLEWSTEKGLARNTLRRWCKFLLGLVILGILVQIFTWLG